MYNSNELPKRRKIEPDEFADLLCSGEMVMIREPDLDKHPKHRIYRYSPKDIFVYQPKVSNFPTSIPYDTCLQGFTDRFVLWRFFRFLVWHFPFFGLFPIGSAAVRESVFVHLRTKNSKLKIFYSRKFQVQRRRILTYAHMTFIALIFSAQKS